MRCNGLVESLSTGGMEAPGCYVLFSVTRTFHLRSTLASDDNRSQFEDADFSWDAQWDTDHSSIVRHRYNHDSYDCFLRILL